MLVALAHRDREIQAVKLLQAQDLVVVVVVAAVQEP
jgi:hypothetical protein